MKIILTADGSNSIHLAELDETYHSVHGAIQESTHVFIEAGLKHWLSINKKSSAISILEFGFGTGLNAILTAIEAVKNGRNITYHCLEKFPLTGELSTSLNYGEILENSTLFRKIHTVPWEKEQAITANYSIKKIEIDFQDYATDSSYDIIYFDAFAPSKQPELWTKSMLENCYSLLTKGGVFIIYSAKGQLKRDLAAIGFKVESLPGPPGKFEITRAIK